MYVGTRECLAGPKILTLPNSDPGCKASLPEVPAGNVKKFCTFFVRNVHVEDNGILFEYAYSFFWDQFLTLPNLDIITAHSSLITAQMGSVLDCLGDYLIRKTIYSEIF